MLNKGDDLYYTETVFIRNLSTIKHNLYCVDSRKLLTFDTEVISSLQQKEGKKKPSGHSDQLHKCERLCIVSGRSFRGVGTEP